MKNNDKNLNILHPNPVKIISLFAVIFIIMEIIFILSFLSSLDEKFIIFTVLLFLTTVVFTALTIKGTYYEISGIKLTHSKLGKTTDYYWNDMVYIDEEYSEQHKMLVMYDKNGKDHYFIFDKDWKIYETALNKVKQISREEMLRRFPNVKL